MKTKISELISQKLHLTDPSGNILGEVFMESGGLIKLKVGTETNDFIINNPIIELIDPVVSHTLTLDISKNQNYRIKLVTNIPAGSDFLTLVLNTEVGKVSNGNIVFWLQGTNPYYFYNIPNCKNLNQPEGYPLGIQRDVLSYFYDGKELFISGIDIKTVATNSILGSGSLINITISATEPSTSGKLNGDIWVES